MASAVAAHLLENDKVDIIVCFSPSNAISRSFKAELEKRIGGRFEGDMGSLGVSYTYHKMLTLPESFWQLFETKRVFTILDEIHHCSGLFEQQANSWGRLLLKRVQDKALYTMALSGTPWRSDRLPLSLAEYCEDGRLVHGYIYSLLRAISEGVCRTPKIVLFDSDRVSVRNGNNVDVYSSFSEALDSSPQIYRDLIYSAAVYEALIDGAVKKLGILKRQFPEAGGLIVAGSIEHAFSIQCYLSKQFQIDATVVTHLQSDAQDKIDVFRDSKSHWIISVGMISEGTDIPRLMVCCYLSLARTEMYFRQVLGRIIRKTSQESEYGYFYMLADPDLVRFAENLQQEIPTEKLIAEVTCESAFVEASANTDDPLESIETSYATSHSQSNLPNEKVSVEGINQLLPLQNMPTNNYSFGTFKSQLMALLLGP